MTFRLSSSAVLSLACIAFGPLAGCRDAALSARPPFEPSRAWKQLETLVGFGPRTPGGAALERTRAHLESELTSYGLKPARQAFHANTPVGPFEFANVVADLPARAPGADVVILATHFDTKLGIDGFVGANDGGSGTAALLELARVLAAGGPRDLTYRFLFLDGEEATRADWEGEDNCYGSRHAAAELKRSGEAAHVRALILLDMVGDADLELLRESWSDQRLFALVQNAARKAGEGAHFGTRSEPIEDDHGAFLALGIPSVDLIDFDYGPNNSWWHTRDDTLAHCAPESLAAIARIVLASLPAIENDFERAR